MQDHHLEAAEIGEQLGTEGIGKLISNAEDYCACEERRIALTNDPHIIARSAEAAVLLDEEREIVDRLRLAPPHSDLRTRRRKALHYGVVTAVLMLSAFVFSLYSLEPYRIGLKAYLYCLGIAIVEPFLLDYVLDPWKGQVVKKSIASVACGAGLLSLILLATIRGDLLAEQSKSSTSVLTIDDAPAQPSQPENTFYDKTTPLLQLVMILLSIAMELGAGFALHEIWRLTAEDTEDWNKLRKRLFEVRMRLGGLVFEIRSLQIEPQAFSARFWSNFYKAMLTRSVRSAMTKLLVAVLGSLFILHGVAAAQIHTDIVVALDLTMSEAVQAPDGKTEFQKNVDAVTTLLARVPADSHITVIGITDHSFSQAYILLSASVAGDRGYFDERLGAARSQLIRAWKARSAKLQPKFHQTDIIGVLVLGAQIFAAQSGSQRKILIVYSDMRNSTPELNLETTSGMPRFSDVGRKLPIPNLHNVQVSILGVDGTGGTVASWQALRSFWEEYFRKTGATLEDYSLLR